jgi:hypothetical protein
MIFDTFEGRRPPEQTSADSWCSENSDMIVVENDCYSIPIYLVVEIDSLVIYSSSPASPQCTDHRTHARPTFPANFNSDPASATGSSY